MSKNKNKPNAFLFFMLEWKKQEEKKGRSFPNGLKDVQTDPECNSQWRSLSEQEKARYKTLEKTNRYQPDVKKKTGLGENLSDIQKAQMKEREFKDNMSEYISSVVRIARKQNSIQDLKFYLIHVNYFYSRTVEPNDVEYYPAEIAIAEFTLEEGATRIYHEIINEKVKLGFCSAAKDQSSTTHHIPTNAPFGKSDYKEIYRDICKFLEPSKKDGKLPPLYTLFTKEDVYYPVKSVMTRLAIADNKADDHILIYSFEDLFTVIHNCIISQSNSIKIEPIIAAIELKKDPFAYKLGLECEYHGNLKVGVLYCSLSYIKRWFFVLTRFCCEYLEIQMIPGIHVPKEQLDTFVNVGKLNSTFSSLSLNDSRRDSSVLSMSGVSSDHRIRVSERTDQEEARRRAESFKPSAIMNHNLNAGAKKFQEPLERPLRAPLTKSAGVYFDSTDTESIDFSEASFPSIGSSIGRGAKMKRAMEQNLKPGQSS